MSASEASPDATAESATDGVWVVGVDGSATARNALEWAAGAARDRDVTIAAVSAWQYPYRGVMPIAGSAIPAIDADMGEAIEEELVATAGEVAEATGARITAATGVGPAAQVLLEQSEPADLAVVGNRGRGGFARLLLGSVSLQLATHARCPVVIVPGDADYRGLRRVVIGVDGSDNSIAALLWAEEFAPATSELVALGVGAPAEAVAASALPSIGREASEAEFLAAVDRAEAAASVPGRFVRVFEHGDPRQRLGERAAEADLLVVGERGHRGLSAVVLGSVATDVIHRLVCPTAVVPVPGTAGGE